MQRNNQYVSKLNSARAKKTEFGKFTGVCTLIGTVFGLVGCVYACSVDGQELDIVTESFIFLFSRILIGAVIGLGVGLIIDILAKITYHGSISSTNNSIAAAEKDLQEKISDMETSKIQKAADYLEMFEREAQNQSVRLAESELATDVVTWMTEGFSKTIDAADRRPHVTQVNVPFVFNIFAEKITCNLGTFDFELKRCRNLQSPVEQTALARAIASSIKLNITMEYPKEVSDAGLTIDINYSYTDSSATATVVYLALNSNFQETKGW